MKAARLVVLGVAVAAGGVAALLAGRSHQPEAPKATVAPLETVDVLVAKTDLDRGQLIQASDIGWQSWPKAAANGNFIQKTARPNAIDQFVGAIVRAPVAAGQPIYDPMVVFAKGSGFMAAILPKGMRAVAMDVSPDSAAGGFILPEDHVDVVLTHRDKAAEKKMPTSKNHHRDHSAQRARARGRPDGRGKERHEGRRRQDRDARTPPQQAETLALSRSSVRYRSRCAASLDSQSSTSEGSDE